MRRNTIPSPIIRVSLTRGLVKRNGMSTQKTVLIRCSRYGFNKNTKIPGTRYKILRLRLILRPRKWKYHVIVGGMTQKEPTIPIGVSSLYGTKHQELFASKVLKTPITISKLRIVKFPWASIRVNLCRRPGILLGTAFIVMTIPRQKMDQ